MDSDSEQARRLSHEEDCEIDDHEAQADMIDNDLEDNDSMLRPQDSLLEDGTGSEYACSPVATSGVGVTGNGGFRAHAGLVLGPGSANNDVMDEDDDTKDEQSSIMLALNESENSPISNVSSSHRSRNKRKNFKPRNINYFDQASEQQASLPVKKLHLMPQTRDINGPMDLSVQGTNGTDMLDNGIDDDNDDEEEEASEDLQPSQEPMTSSASLSVVRPEVLFGGQKEPIINPLLGSIPGGGGGGAVPPGIPPFLAPFLAASSSPSGPGGPNMKDAFQEVLKLFGFPPELAEVFAKNAQALQQQNKDPSSNPSPGLSAAAAAAAAAASAGMSQEQPHAALQAGGQDQGNYMFNYSW